MSIFERELSLLSRAPSSHWLIERPRWGPLVGLWSLEGFASNIVTQVFGTWSPSLGDPAGYPEWGYLVRGYRGFKGWSPQARVPLAGGPQAGGPQAGGHQLT